MARRIRIGDVIEIMTSRGLAYAQVTHIHKTDRSAYGPLLRVLPGFFGARPSEFDELVLQEPVSMMFCPLRQALRSETCEVVGNVSVPEKARAFPLFRVTNDIGMDTNPKDWWFWNGEESWFVGKLQPRQMPISEIVSPSLFRERVETGWDPGSDPGDAIRI